MLRNQINKCQACPLYKQIMMLPSLGVGGSSPDIMFIIGGVDRENLVFEKPFSDISEMILLKSLDKAEIDKSRCYITSIIKCGTLLDKKEYIKICSNWILEEIDEFKPKVLFFLGQKTHELFCKYQGNIQIKTFIEPNTLHGIFNRNSSMSSFINRLKLANEFCKVTESRK